MGSKVRCIGITSRGLKQASDRNKLMNICLDLLDLDYVKVQRLMTCKHRAWLKGLVRLDGGWKAGYRVCGRLCFRNDLGWDTIPISYCLWDKTELVDISFCKGNVEFMSMSHMIVLLVVSFWFTTDSKVYISLTRKYAHKCIRIYDPWMRVWSRLFSFLNFANCFTCIRWRIRNRKWLNRV